MHLKLREQARLGTGGVLPPLWVTVFADESVVGDAVDDLVLEYPNATVRYVSEVELLASAGQKVAPDLSNGTWSLADMRRRMEVFTVGGEVRNVWLRTEDEADDTGLRDAVEKTENPAGFVGLHMHGGQGAAWVGDRRLDPVMVAVLLAEIGVTKPVLVQACATLGGKGSFAVRLVRRIRRGCGRRSRPISPLAAAWPRVTVSSPTGAGGTERPSLRHDLDFPQEVEEQASSTDAAQRSGVDDAVRTPVLGPIQGVDGDLDGVDGFALAGVGSDVEGVVGSSLVGGWERTLAGVAEVAAVGLERLGAEPDEGSVLAEAAAVAHAVLAGFRVAAVPVEWAVRDEVEELRSRAEFDHGSNTIRLGRSDDPARLMATAVHEAVHVLQHAVVGGAWPAQAGRGWRSGGRRRWVAMVHGLRCGCGMRIEPRSPIMWPRCASIGGSRRRTRGGWWRRRGHELRMRSWRTGIFRMRRTPGWCDGAVRRVVG